MSRSVDIWLFLSVIALAIIGFFVFLSAALGLLGEEGSGAFARVVTNQSVSFVLGLAALWFFSRVNFKHLQRYSLYIFVVSIAITALVFVPALSIEHGGAARWIDLGVASFQPAEFLKLGFVLYFAAWLSAVKRKIHSPFYTLVPFGFFAAIIGGLLLLQPDTGTFLVILAAGGAMFIAAGSPWRYNAAVAGGLAAILAVLAWWRPYIRERIITFFQPAMDPLGAGYQIQQSLIAIGSGDVFGRGFGQSIQKFTFLPEPLSDSIFAVYAEEFGLIGGLVLIALFALFAIRGIYVAHSVPPYFAQLAIIGLVCLIVGQAFFNIGAMLGIFPLSGLPLPFVSHGGTALIFTFIEAGIVLNISRFRR